jgi:hypothetical protein
MENYAILRYMTLDIWGCDFHVILTVFEQARMCVMPNDQGHERRQYPRFHGLHLMANIGGKLVRVAEISAGGMTLESGFTISASTMRFTLYPTESGKVDINHGVGGIARVVREDPQWVSLRFEPATYRLVKFIAECSDVGPEKDSFLGR